MISEHWPTGSGAPPPCSITGLGGQELLYRSTVSVYFTCNDRRKSFPPPSVILSPYFFMACL